MRGPGAATSLIFKLIVPATALFSYPTVASFSGMLFERLDLGASAPEGVIAHVPVPATIAAEPESVRALSDDDALAALRMRRPSQRGAS